MQGIPGMPASVTLGNLQLDIPRLCILDHCATGLLSIKLPARSADMVLDRICRMRDMDDKSKPSMLHFRHGALMLALQKMVDEVVKHDIGFVNEYAAQLQKATAGTSIVSYNPGMLETVKLIKLPLALVCFSS
jgi:hypothetical protein